MIVRKGEINGISFYHREGFSDLKTFEEVIGNKVYLKKGMTINKGEKWMDCGGNVGAFALLACSKGADVTIYEPDPFNCKMIQKNLDLNGFKATIKQAALVHNDSKQAFLFIGNNNQTWRNSIVKKWNNKGIKVPCLNFDDEAKRFSCCKMDIEGAEMPILENTKKVFSKMCFEWSFDIDKSMKRYKDIIDRMRLMYGSVEHSKQFYNSPHGVLPNNVFPKADNVFCYEKN